MGEEREKGKKWGRAKGEIMRRKRRKEGEREEEKMKWLKHIIVDLYWYKILLDKYHMSRT